MKYICNMEPYPKARPVTTSNGRGKVWTFTPKPTKAAEETLVMLFKQARVPMFEEHVPLSVNVIFWRTKPASIVKTETHPVRRPDLDNYEKWFGDALVTAGIVHDEQICKMCSEKAWTKLDHGYVEFDIEVISDAQVSQVREQVVVQQQNKPEAAKPMPTMPQQKVDFSVLVAKYKETQEREKRWAESKQ
jgi:Holliday junction resolvase RusA-like endonuclease